MNSPATPVHFLLILFVLFVLPAEGLAQSGGPTPRDTEAVLPEARHVASMEARQHLEGGRRLERESNLMAAIASYSKAASLAPDSAEIHFALGEALTKAERLQDALVRYTLAVTIAPEHGPAFQSRAQLCLRMGLYAQARKDLTRLISLRPGVADYHYQRATTHMKLRNMTEAYHDFLRAHELDKKYPRPTLIWKKDSVATKTG